MPGVSFTSDNSARIIFTKYGEAAHCLFVDHGPPLLCQLCTAVHTSSVDWIWSSWNTRRMSKLFTASFCHCRGTGARYPDTLIGMDRSCRHSRATVHQRRWVVVGLSIPVSPSDQWIEYTELIRPSSILSEIVFDVPLRRLDTAAYRSPGLRTQSPGMRSHSFKSDKWGFNDHPEQKSSYPCEPPPALPSPNEVPTTATNFPGRPGVRGIFVKKLKADGNSIAAGSQ